MNRLSARPKEIAGIVDLLLQSGVIIYPTETVYGLGCLASQSSAIDRVVELKGSAPEAAFLILVGGHNRLSQFCYDIPLSAEPLIQHFWPGPLTLILPAVKGLHPRLVGPSGGVALRFSSHPWCEALLCELPDGLISTSANHSGADPPEAVDELDERLADDVDIILDGGRLKGGLSTLLDLCQDPPVILRDGAVPASEIEHLIGPIKST